MWKSIDKVENKAISNNYNRHLCLISVVPTSLVTKAKMDTRRGMGWPINVIGRKRDTMIGRVHPSYEREMWGTQRIERRWCDQGSTCFTHIHFQCDTQALAHVSPPISHLERTHTLRGDTYTCFFEHIFSL